MKELEEENKRLYKVIQQKDDRINDLLERLDNLALLYQKSLQSQCKCSPEKNETND
jgi:nitrogen-specific signal transduction histidine kinase